MDVIQLPLPRSFGAGSASSAAAANASGCRYDGCVVPFA